VGEEGRENGPVQEEKKRCWHLYVLGQSLARKQRRTRLQVRPCLVYHKTKNFLRFSVPPNLAAHVWSIKYIYENKTNYTVYL